ncbi:Tetratricopeptide repeat-containing protein [Sphingomonas guangdongensis]|uniref:Tetratricopeptide repeat-containing protein n=1 Tax=Sphingomonas guangdongensis TaxID=1141890 RepID=A0A285R1A0_9SPHN|nr:tetratricopeptide repeat protein [Sphingomonas guangdongensis]SOB87509.1 Tetratricopeptide repeat-containing protein [Sphingomonas guangdongensis]
MPTAAHANTPEALGAYVRARALDAAGQVNLAAANYAAALAAAPGDPVVAVRAYREGIAAGDLALATRAAAVLEQAGVAPPDTAVLALARAVHGRDWTAAQAAAARLERGPLAFLAPAALGWIAFERGAPDLSALTADSSNLLARRFNAENRALLQIAGGQVDAGLASLRLLLGIDAGNAGLRISAAQLLAARGRKEEARALLAGDDPVLAAERRALGRRVKPGAAWGVARLFDRLAADIADGDARTLAILLTRSALLLDPRDDGARLILAQALAADGSPGTALATLAQVSASSPRAAAAPAVRIAILAANGDGSAALTAAARLNDDDDASGADARRLGDLLAGAGRYDEAAAAYATAIARTEAPAEWSLLLQRGGALERAGRWEEARPLLEQAAALAPDEPVVLNYLGYAQVERGENVAAARALLERAARLRPDDAAITDSLGWAYVMSGDLAKALPLLERAARAEPADVAIQEHLGDALWRSGRRYEARYAWRAASVYADAGEAERLSLKLARGLERAQP